MAGIVHVPTIGAGRVRFVPLTVRPYPELDGKARFANAPDLPNTTDLLIDARHHEPPGRRDRGIYVIIDSSSVVDRSYGLGLAIADKLSVFGGSEGHVIATGVLVDRGLGDVAPVGDFDAKVAAILAAAPGLPRPLLFAFPAQQLGTLRHDLRAQLEALEKAANIRLFACSTVSDAAPIWTSAGAVSAPGPQRRRWLQAVLGAVGLATAAVAYAWYQAPIRQCEAATSRLVSAPMRQDLAVAVASCRAAVARFPDDGRMLFLAGQALVANAGGAVDPDAMDLLAQSAAKGDSDGRVAYAHAIWLSPLATARARAQSATQLAAEAKADNAAAAELLGLIRLVGDPDTPGDRAAAAPWLARAIRLRHPATTASEDMAKLPPSPWEQLGPIGLTATLDRAVATYPAQTSLGISIMSRRPVTVGIWRVDASGMATLLTEQILPAGEMARVLPAGSTGRHHLLVIARALDLVPPETGMGRALGADAGLVGSNSLAVKWLPYNVASR